MNGSEAEDLAARYLQQQHLVLVERNYRCRYGEIDLIMHDQSMLVFIEVKMRTHASFGGAIHSITELKQHKLILTANHYLANLKKIPPCRFDVVLITGQLAYEINWIKNAFGE